MSNDSICYIFVVEVPDEELISLYRAGGWWEELPHSRANLGALVRGSFCFLTVRFEGKLIGMGRVISDGVSDGYLQDVIVLPEFRGRGIGKEIVRRLRDYCLERHLEWIGLVAEPNLKEFYEGLGFKVMDGDFPMLLKPASSP